MSSDFLPNEPGAADFGDTYLEHFDAVYGAVVPVLARQPELAQYFAAQTPEKKVELRAYARQRVERLVAGDWEQYAVSLVDEGKRHARLGLGFGAWEDVARIQGRVLIGALAQRFAAEPERMQNALIAHDAFAKRCFSLMADAYVGASEAPLRMWEALFHKAPWGILVLDPDVATIRYANDACKAMYGLADADLGHRQLFELFDPDDLARVRRTHSEAAIASGRTSYETVHVRADGTRFPVLLDGVRVPSARSGELAWALSVRDLTERRQMESLRVRSAELEMENRRVQEASRLKSEFLANMSHELRTPLNSILGFSELMLHGEVGVLEAQQREFVGDIHTSGKHLLRLINDVLDLSKVEAGKLELHAEEFELAALVQEVAGVLRAVAGARAISLQIAIDPSLGVVQLDPARLKQVLYNYLSNAIKFSPHGAQVHISVAPEGTASFRIEVRDVGIGIAEEDLSRLFVEFEQLDRGRAKEHGGTGLGLALTRRLVQAQGGTVGVRSTPGAGSTFYAVLPLRLPDNRPLPQPRHFEAPTGAPSVLVIEDDAQDQERIVTSLVAAGYSVDTAATGAQAMRAIEERKYDAITLDLLLPDTSGLAMVQSLRKSPGMENVPVIVISVVSEQVTAGFVVSDALQKPLKGNEPLEALQRAGVVPPARGPVLVVDDDESSSRLISVNLHQLGYRVTTARDGAEALAAARAERPSAVVLDLVMPNLDGFGFLQEFRKHAIWAKIPVIVWTVKDLTRDEHERLLASAAAVLPKDGTGASAIAELIRQHLPQTGVSA